jgi:hypothetical protein
MGDLNIDIEDAARVSKYSFGTGTADFHICTICGVVPVVTSEIDGMIYAVVNVNAMEGVEGLLKRAPISFEGEDETTRLARRKRNWIGRVRFSNRA